MASPSDLPPSDRELKVNTCVTAVASPMVSQAVAYLVVVVVVAVVNTEVLVVTAALYSQLATKKTHNHYTFETTRSIFCLLMTCSKL